jgi:MerR family transcriptional regulator, light-induced transcriptional regulator
MPQGGWKIMKSKPDGRLGPDKSPSLSSLDKIAVRALSEVALKARVLKDDPDPRAIEMLFDAAIGPDPLACRSVAKLLVSKGVAPERICDIYIPAIARRMGDDWCTDELSFSSITIGTARLQYLLRELGPSNADEVRWDDESETQSVLLLVARDADHTLGAMVLATQLRRRGFSVKLSIGEDAEHLMTTLSDGKFDAIFLSACQTDDLEALRGLVENIRMSLTSSAPIILGGYIVEQNVDVLAITGVDMVTSQLDEALEFCSLSAK